MNSFIHLGEHASKIGSGQTPRGGSQSYVSKGIPLIRSQNVLMNLFSNKGLVFIPDKQHETMSGSKVMPGDVLLNITGASIGRVCVVPYKICPANVNQHVCIIRCKDSISPEWLAFFLASPKFQSFIIENQIGGTRQALTKGMIEEFRIPSQSIHAQRRIAACLKAQLLEVDKAHQAAETQLHETKNLANAIIYESLKKRNATQTLLGDALEEIKKGIGANWKSYPVLGATRNGLAPAKEPPGKNPHRYKPVVPGTVFYNPMRILIGSIAYVDVDDKPGITSPDYVALIGKKGVVDSLWFYYWLRSPLGEQFIKSLARGAVRERILFKRLALGKVELPAFSTQQAAAKALAQLKPMRQAIEKKIDELNLLPAKILARAFESIT